MSKRNRKKQQQFWCFKQKIVNLPTFEHYSSKNSPYTVLRRLERPKKNSFCLGLRSLYEKKAFEVIITIWMNTIQSDMFERFAAQWEVLYILIQVLLLVPQRYFCYCSTHTNQTTNVFEHKYTFAIWMVEFFVVNENEYLYINNIYLGNQVLNLGVGLGVGIKKILLSLYICNILRKDERKKPSNLKKSDYILIEFIINTYYFTIIVEA